MISLLWTICFTGLLLRGSSLELKHGYITNNENNTWKDVELRHRIKDSSYLLDNYPIGELSPDISICRKHAKCVPLHKNSCMGTKLPYSTTTLDLIPESVTQDIIEVNKIIHIFFAVMPSCFFFL